MAAEAVPEDWAAAIKTLDEFQSHITKIVNEIKFTIEKPIFDAKLKDGLEIIELARNLPPANKTADEALRLMEEALDLALKEENNGFYLAGARALQTAIDKATIIAKQRRETSEHFYPAKKQVDDEFNAVKQRLTGPDPPPDAVADALKQADEAQTSLLAGLDQSPDDLKQHTRNLNDYSKAVSQLTTCVAELMEKRGFDQELDRLNDAVDAASLLSKISDRAAAASQEMWKLYNAAMAEVGNEDYPAAKTLLSQTEQYIQIIHDEYYKSLKDPSIREAFWKQVDEPQGRVREDVRGPWNAEAPGRRHQGDRDREQGVERADLYQDPWRMD